MTRKLIFTALLTAALFLGQSMIPEMCLAKTSADNTAINKRDRSSDEMTAEQQGGNEQDRELTRRIRHAVVKEKSLSTNAHNVKIVTADGVVTLKGPVQSEQEKQMVEELAAGIAGRNKVKNEIDIRGGQAPQ